MFSRMVIPLAAALAGGVVLQTGAFAQNAERGCIELKSVAEIEESYVDERGNPAKRLVPAAKVVPGAEVVWTIVARNICTTPAGDIAITNPIPEHTRYVDDSAFGPGTSIEFSLDGASYATPAALTVAGADGSRRPARADEYKHIRWVLPRPMNPSEQLTVRYRAVVL